MKLKGETAIVTGASRGLGKAIALGLATEVGQYNIAINAIKPLRVIDTEGMSVWQGDVDKSEWQTPDKMVRCAVFLAAQNAQGVTRHIIN